MSPSNVPPVRRRLLLTAACLLALLLVCTISFIVVRNGAVPGEETFGPRAAAQSAPLDVYLDVLAIDPVRESMDLRLDLATGSGDRGTQYYAPLHREVALAVSDGEFQQEFLYKRDALVSSRSFTASLRGGIGGYPFDRYATRIVTMAHEVRARDNRLALPLRLTVWGGVAGWAVHTTDVRSSTDNSETVLTFSIQRPAPLVFFACVLYGIIVLIAASALVIGTLIFMGIRRVEPTLISALAAMAFALPALRNLLPGVPPLGVIADVAIVLWAELAVAAGVVLIVVAWARRGAT